MPQMTDRVKAATSIPALSKPVRKGTNMPISNVAVAIYGRKELAKAYAARQRIARVLGLTVEDFAIMRKVAYVSH